MKMKYLYIGLVFALGTFLLTGSYKADGGDACSMPANANIIKFSHAKHAELAECDGCHASVKSSVALTDRLLPKHDDCAACHDVSDQNNCTQCHFDGVFEPLVQSKPHVFFSHKAHAEQGEQCQSCHSGISAVDYASASHSTKPSMETCYRCHGEVKTASNACEACHISTAALVPENHKVANFVRSHKNLANSPRANCVMCHDNQSCNDCHIATTGITETNGATDFYTPFVQTENGLGNGLQKVSKVHDLNYRFTHGIDVKGKGTECITCHQTETFCAECHTSEKGDFALAGIIPSSHAKAGFVTIGVGTGGGQHALLAKRDIERCASCHDAAGADPVCITCHVDNDGIKGTNPRTHEKGFMKDSELGDWHDDAGSVCYTCHTDATAKPSGIAGVGFCGYCHGAK